jgi:hypothetical protein
MPALSQSQDNLPLSADIPVWETRNMEMDRLYSVKDAAQQLGGLSPYTIHAWLSSGKLKRSKVGARTMIRGSELARIIEDGAKSPGRHRRSNMDEKNKSEASHSAAKRQ